ncbi:60S ribosomal protein L32 [Manis javanica]|nr:60S ribosomal protein L32 [Manis javanica]
MPNIGYGSNKTKYMLPGDFRKFLVHKVKELGGLPKFKNSAEIPHKVSSQNCKATVERAAQLAVSHQSQCQGV